MTEENLLGFMFFEGSVTSKDFLCFLIKLLKKFPLIKSNLKSTVFFMDNATIHKALILD